MKQLYILLLFSCLNVFAKTDGIQYQQNKGQWPKQVLYGSFFSASKIFIEQSAFLYCLYDAKDLVKARELHGNKGESNGEPIIKGHNYKVNFEGADFSKIEPIGKQAYYSNYFLGNDKTKWASEVASYSTLELKNVYCNIDMKLYSEATNLKYDFILKPGSNTKDIVMNYQYTNGIELRNNHLYVLTSIGEVVEQKPFAYQLINGKRVEVSCFYIKLDSDKIGFTFPNGYDKRYELIIDPVVVVCSYSGATVHCNASCSSYDENGKIYTAGYAVEANYPTTLGVFQTSFNGLSDFLLEAYTSNGSSKLFATYIGGSKSDLVLDICIKNNEITLTGFTESSNFPVSETAVDTSFNGVQDFVITKLNQDGSQLIASTYIGGSSTEGVFGVSYLSEEFLRYMEMAVDDVGNVTVFSNTFSSDFPVTINAYSTVKQGSSEACVFRLNADLSQLKWSTYLGGSRSESARAMRLDKTGGVYCFGMTDSPDFPVTSNAYATSKLGTISAVDMFVTLINSTGTALLASTYLGTTANDFASLIDLDSNGDVYLCGNIDNSAAFVSSPTKYSDVGGRNVIYKMNALLSSVIFKSKFGYTTNISGPGFNFVPYLFLTAFKVDSCQNIYLSGWAHDKALPTTPNNFQNYGGGVTDLYFSVFKNNCTALSFASYFGGAGANGYNFGEHTDGGLSHFDNKGYLYQAICAPPNLPTTPNAYALTTSNTTTNTYIWNNAFVKIDFQTFVNASSSYGSQIIGCPAPFTASFVSTTNTGNTQWSFGDGSPLSTQTNTTHTYSNYGNYNVVLVVTDSNTCNRTDSIKSLLSVIPPTEFELGDERLICLNSRILLRSNVSAISYTWSTGANSTNIFVTQPGTYGLTISNGGCTTSDEITVKLGEEPLTARFPNIMTPNGDGVNDVIDFNAYKFDEMEFILFDRWGNERYRTKEITKPFDADGYHDGTYYYVVQYLSTCTGRQEQSKGFISIFR